MARVGFKKSRADKHYWLRREKPKPKGRRQTNYSHRMQTLQRDLDEQT
jgi:hypothetical protein